MFSGIVEEIGSITAIEPLASQAQAGPGKPADGVRLRILAPQTCRDAQIGESIAVSGVCLTVVSFDSQSFEVDAVSETLRRTRLGELVVGSGVNLEKSLRLGDRVGGHLVTGHIDALGRVVSVIQDGASWNLSFELEPEWSAYFVDKGSVAVDGISLTVADCSPHGSRPFHFRVALIPHTMQVTTLGKAKPGDRVNIETDMLGRYAARLLGAVRGGEGDPKGP